MTPAPLRQNNPHLICCTLSTPRLSAKIPLEVCEIIIDECRCAPWPVSDRLQTLQACALVCRAWLPCSRRNLWRRVIATRQTCCYRLVEALKQSPELAKHIFELEIYGSSGIRHPSLLGIVPRRDKRFPENLKTLEVHHFDFGEYHWKRYNTYLAHFPPITHLEFHNVVFESATDFYRLVWAFPHLVSISVGHTRFRMRLSEVCEKRFRALCTIRSDVHCRNLRRVSIKHKNIHDEGFIFPQNALGSLVDNLSLEIAMRSLVSLGQTFEDLRRYFTAFKDLEKMCIQIILDQEALPHLQVGLMTPLFCVVSEHAQCLKTLRLDCTIVMAKWDLEEFQSTLVTFYKVVFGRPGANGARGGPSPLPGTMETLVLALNSQVDHRDHLTWQENRESVPTLREFMLATLSSIDTKARNQSR
ncbi:hypothetical protein PYCCODRAFT_450210 [Trametes coccinea BRFM310]|uniref:F-box domain-containing protein n=1 Tax=Trametes coccinea (strain BRFM310) TaxID=1353009 RepID=A0A1Y2IM45_TRAC3|nr:hypothetical protein PYCCODRAFT_450210 [Trametes coccinea BRFM310]